LSAGLALNGTYTLAANGRGTAILNAVNNTLNLAFYAAGGSRIVFIEVDNVDPAVEHSRNSNSWR
jgi:hypothetical protein